jgi:hypothetical protein
MARVAGCSFGTRWRRNGNAAARFAIGDLADFFVIEAASRFIAFLRFCAVERTAADCARIAGITIHRVASLVLRHRPVADITTWQCSACDNTLCTKSEASAKFVHTALTPSWAFVNRWVLGAQEGKHIFIAAAARRRRALRRTTTAAALSAAAAAS